MWMKTRTSDGEETCFICGGEVVPSEDERAQLKAERQGMPLAHCSERFFICISCGAYVMADRDDSGRPAGILADSEMRYLRRRIRQECRRLCGGSEKNLLLLEKTLKEALGLDPGEDLKLKEMDERMLRRTLSILTSASCRRMTDGKIYIPWSKRSGYGRRRKKT